MCIRDRPRLFQRAFSLKFDSLPDGTRDKLIFRITRQEKLRRIVDLLGYDPSLVLHVNFGLLEDECCRTAFMRGAFLAGGSVTDPEKRYHLELATSHMQASREVSALLTEMGFVPHSVRRSGSSVIYFKQSEHIEDLLTTIGAPAAAMDIMTAKVDKEIRNGANRAMNCEDVYKRQRYCRSGRLRPCRPPGPWPGPPSGPPGPGRRPARCV